MNLFKLIIKAQQNKHKADLHSFMAKTNKGIAFIDASGIDGIRISLNGEVIGVYNAIQATNKLEQMGIDLDSIDF